MKNIAVIIGGCGHMDGSEIQESVSTLLALSKANACYQCFSVNDTQFDHINHYTQQEDSTDRNLIVEAARIARGDIKELSELEVEKFDALILPGGFGVAKNFMTYAQNGVNGTVRVDIKSVIQQFHRNQKYIGAICISPMLLALTFKDTNVTLTLTGGELKADGNTNLLHDHLNDAGAEVMLKNSGEICIDYNNKVVSTPAYINDATLSEVYTGIELLVNHIVENC